MGSDMARVLDAGDNLRVLPMIGKGSLQNLVDILRLKNIDMGFVVGDALRVGIRLAHEAIRQHEKRCSALQIVGRQGMPAAFFGFARLLDPLAELALLPRSSALLPRKPSDQ
jgi:hypothetical protein